MTLSPVISAVPVSSEVTDEALKRGWSRIWLLTSGVNRVNDGYIPTDFVDEYRPDRATIKLAGLAT